MPTDPRVDAYIDRQADFARPILETIRARVHAACPEAAEAMKWSMPAFTYKGAILGIMAAFKAHATFGLWRGSEVLGETGAEREAMGQFGKLRSVDDLPGEAELAAIIRDAAALQDSGARHQREPKAPKPEIAMPADFAAALGAQAARFAAMTPGCRREYVEWIEAAKRPETRAKRIAQAAAQVGEGKKLHWKYETC